MPIRECIIGGNPGYAWGKRGKCYEYDPSSEASKEAAKKKAIAQAVAIGDFEALAENMAIVRGTYRREGELKEIDGEKLAGLKVSFDYDGVLSEPAWRQRAKAMSALKYIVTARLPIHMGPVYKAAEEIGIPRSRVFSTGSNKAKIEKVKQLGVDRHYDDNPSVIAALPGIGSKI